MRMTVGDLMDTLEGFDPEAEVRIAEVDYRSRFEYTIDDIAEIDVSNSDDEEVEFVVYLLEGTQIGYLPSVVCDELGV